MEIDTRSSLPHAASALLRHRLFPRAMAWNIHQAAQHNGARYDDVHMDYPSSRDHDEYAYTEPNHAPYKSAKLHSRGSPLSSLAATAATATAPASASASASASFAPTVDGRERLFRTIGKWLDQRPTETIGYAAQQQRPQYQYAAYDCPSQAPPLQNPRHAAFDMSLPPAPAQRGSIYDMVKLHQQAHSGSGSGSPSPSAYTARSSRTMSLSSHPSPTHSQSSNDGGNSKKRQRGPSGSTVPLPTTSSSTPTPTTTSSGVARPGMSSSSAKRCSFVDCGKIAVSKGLCRGHGGGRRCTFAGCTKCAQSRSPFCWAHGGGKRCEAPNCRRSRKTKRFCVDHVELEHTVPMSTSTDSDSDHHSSTPTPSTDSTGCGSTTVASSHNIAALHLPSLTDALKRAVPSAVARAATQSTVTLPQSRDRMWPVPQATAMTLPFH